MALSTPGIQIAVGTAKEYLWRLEAAGYLIILQPAANHRLTRYRLRPSQGPKAPKLLKAALVYDPNRKEIVGPALCEEDRP